MLTRLLAWRDGDDRDDDVGTSCLSDAVLATNSVDLRTADGESGRALVDYLERIAVRADKARSEGALRALEELSSATDQVVAGAALAYTFYYFPTRDRAASIARYLSSPDGLGYADVLSAVKQLLKSDVPSEKRLAQLAIELVKTSPEDYECLLNDLKD